MLVEAGASTVVDATTHRMLFWPKQTHSYFLVMNARQSSSGHSWLKSIWKLRQLA